MENFYYVLTKNKLTKKRRKKKFLFNNNKYYLQQHSVWEAVRQLGTGNRRARETEMYGTENEGEFEANSR